MQVQVEAGAGAMTWIGWLRVFAILAVFFYHSLHFFDPGEWSVKNPTLYPWVGEFMALFGLYVMPLIFLISGEAVYYASRKGSAARFAWDKVLRLLVPLLIGIFTFSPTQVYVERVSHGQFQGSFFQFLPHYFEGVYTVPAGSGNFALHGMHLWYLLALFVLTFLFMPLFWLMRGADGTRALRRLGDVLALPGVLLLLVLPTIVLQNLTNSGPMGGFYLSMWRPVHYIWFFLSGYLIASLERLQQRIVQARWVCLALTVLLMALSLAGIFGLVDHPDVAIWPGLYACLGFSMKHLTRNNRTLAYANPAVMPFYILHQNVLLWVGFFVVQWAVPDAARYAISAVSSFAACMLLYEYAIRRADVLRILFGMKTRRRATAATQPAV